MAERLSRIEVDETDPEADRELVQLIIVLRALLDFISV